MRYVCVHTCMCVGRYIYVCMAAGAYVHVGHIGTSVYYAGVCVCMCIYMHIYEE